MIDIVKAMYGDMGINSLIFTLTNRVPAVVDADRCTVYIVDGDELWAMQVRPSVHGVRRLSIVCPASVEHRPSVAMTDSSVRSIRYTYVAHTSHIRHTDATPTMVRISSLTNYLGTVE